MNLKGCDRMYWNTINRFSNKFMVEYKYPPNTIRMSLNYYNHLENEMIGDEFRVLVKRHRVRGCKVVIDLNLKENVAFVLEGARNKDILCCYVSEIK